MGDSYKCPVCGKNHGHPQIDADLYDRCARRNRISRSRDGERLDWLEREARRFDGEVLGLYALVGGKLVLSDEGRRSDIAAGETLRDAIDAAMGRVLEG